MDSILLVDNKGYVSLCKLKYDLHNTYGQWVIETLHWNY